MATTTSKGLEAFTITGNWEKQSKLLKERFSKLTNADLKFEAGKENELISRLVTRLNKKRKDIIDLLKKMAISLD